jgi:hypothetical protein
MSLAGAEIPGAPDSSRPDGGNESLPTITKLNRGLYQLVIYILGVALILLILGWVIITAVGKTVPDGLPVVIATIVGALVGVLSTGKSPS